MEHYRRASDAETTDAAVHPSSIDDVDGGGPNGHLALLYENRDGQFATAIPFVREGLERGERCLYVVDDNDVADVVDAMEAAGIDVEAARDTGLLSLHATADGAPGDGSFDPGDATACLDDVVAETVEERGFERVRVAGEMTWTLDGDGGTDREALAAYEAALGDHVRGGAVTALCQYDRTRFPGAVLRDVVRSHPQFVADGELRRNFDYVPPAQSFTERADAAVDDRVEPPSLPIDGDGASSSDGPSTSPAPDGDDGRAAAGGDSRPVDPTSARRRALANVRRVLDTDRVGVYLYDESTGDLEPRDGAADDVGREDVEDALWEAFVTNETRVLGGERGEDEGRHGEGERGTLVAVPLGRHGAFVAAVDAGPGRDVCTRFVETVGANLRAALDRATRERVVDDPDATGSGTAARSTTVADLVPDVVRALADGTSREDVRRAVCERVVDVDGWRLAWVGTTNATSERVDERAAAGAATAYLDEVTADVGDDPATEPAGRAAATRSTQVVGDVPDDGDGWRRAAAARGLRSAVAVPLVYEGVSYGILTVYGDEPEAFGERERDVLEAIGRAVAFACNAMERRDALVSDRATELDLRVRDESALIAFVRGIGNPVRVQGIVPRDGDDGGDGGRLRVFFTVAGTTAADVDDAAADASPFRSLSLVADREEELLYDGVVDGDGFVGTLLDHAVVPQSLSPDGDGGRLVVRVPPSNDVASFVSMLDDRYPGTELRARREVERTAESRHDFRSRLREELTGRQWDALQTAFLSGYFEWPREQSGQEVGARLDVSQPTFNRHLRDALRKVLTPIFDEDGSAARGDRD